MRTFMFTDIEGSSRLWAGDPDTMSGLLAVHDEILSRIADEHGGSILKHTGDGVFALFDTPSEASAAALEIQLAMASNEVLEGRLRLRIGLHCGDAVERDGDQFGPDVNLTARVMGAALGGQVLLTEQAADGSPPDGAAYRHLGTHSLKDIAEPVSLYSLSHPDLTERYSRIPKKLTVPCNLPAEQTPFVGREAEMIRISSLICSEDCRLLTLLGPGGTGKTRLSMRTALEIGHRFRDGVFFVPLAEITELDDILPQIADSTGFVPEGAGDLAEALYDHLRESEMLLVLDNFEQLTGGANLLSELLESSSGLRMLVSSRERLRLRAEWIFEVPGMEIPPDGASAGGFDSVQLFLNTAKRSGAAPPGEGDYGTVTRICRLLEGSPLAIELAASWCGMISVVEIEEQVSDPASLESVMRDHPERHSSLEAVFTFSWNLLDDALRKTLCSLSVFRGGFDRKAAKEVCGTGLQGLMALRDRSLIWQLEEGRFGMHGSIRHFADKLAQEVLDDQEDISRHHAEYFLCLSAGCEPDLIRGDRSTAIHQLERDLDNIKAALNSAVSCMRADLLRGSIKGISTVLGVKGQFRELERMLLKAISSFDENGGDDLLMANLFALLGWTGSHIHSLAKCESPLARSVELYRRAGSPEDLAYGLNNFANVLNVNGEDDRAEPLYRESLQLSRETGDINGMSAALNNLGILAERHGDLDKAAENYGESASLSESIGNRHGLSISLSNLSTVLREKGDIQGSMDLLTRSLAIQEEIGDSFNVSIINIYRMELLLVLGQREEAAGLCTGSIRCFQEQGHIWWLVRGKLLMAYMHLEEGHLESGVDEILGTLDIYLNHIRNVHISELMAVSAICLSLLGRDEKACTASAIARSSGSMPAYMLERMEIAAGISESRLSPGALDESVKSAQSLGLEDMIMMVREALRADSRCSPTD